jgi:hypothetical protein
MKNINDQLGTYAQAETATYVCIALLMGVILAADKLLFGLLRILAWPLAIICFLLICVACSALMQAQKEGKCVPFTTWEDVVSCAPVVLQSFLDNAKPITDNLIPRARAFPWFPWGISVLGSVLPTTIKAAFEIGILLLVTLAVVGIVVLVVWIWYAIQGARYAARFKHDNTRLRDLVDKVPTLHITCKRCDRKEQHGLAAILKQHDDHINVADWIRKATADCPKRRDRWGDRCEARCSDKFPSRWLTSWEYLGLKLMGERRSKL